MKIPISLRWFPIQLYVYVISAAVFGVGIGYALNAPGTESLLALFVGASGCIAGYVLMRPLIRLANIEIREKEAAKLAEGGE